MIKTNLEISQTKIMLHRSGKIACMPANFSLKAIKEKRVE
jgi:hypothetical protein